MLTRSNLSSISIYSRTNVLPTIAKLLEHNGTFIIKIELEEQFETMRHLKRTEAVKFGNLNTLIISLLFDP